MTEHQIDNLQTSIQNDLKSLQQRANEQRHRHKQAAHSFDRLTQALLPLIASPVATLRRMPTRYLLHAVVALAVPVAVGLSHLPARPLQPTVPVSQELALEAPMGLGPVAIEGAMQLPVGDPPLQDLEAIPVPLSLTSRSEALAPFIVPAAVSGGSEARLRNGPGLEYDAIGALETGTNLQVMGRYGEWLQVRQGEGEPIYWIAAELVDLREATIFSLFEVPSAQIPVAPPPKVATVVESNLNLRDGPGTNYVSMSKLESGQQVELVEQYQDWLHISADGVDGWISSQFVSMQEGVIERVPATETVPDPNPAMVATINDNQVNLRRGPGTSYEKVGAVDSGAAVDVLARHKEWFRVQLSDGTKAWVFSDLLNMDAMVRRRVPYTNDIPALPTVAQRPAAPAGGRAAPAAAAPAPVYAPASGDVASFALQFVGYRYAWGGSSPAGFDCSGFTSYVYRQFGIGLPHSSSAQFSSAYGAPIGNIGNLAPGDLVFFAGTAGPGITHVAIYIGGGRIVHAMAPGLGVQVSDLYSSYWISHYYGAIRPYR
ncbi:MAG: SH3 domain-containing protein [Chloroflexaceae bacterium]|nr:SH3 domain-containing protein [Chloroflexaceae bacterium]